MKFKDMVKLTANEQSLKRVRLRTDPKQKHSLQNATAYEGYVIEEDEGMIRVMMIAPDEANNIQQFDPEQLEPCGQRTLDDFKNFALNYIMQIGKCDETDVTHHNILNASDIQHLESFLKEQGVEHDEFVKILKLYIMSDGLYNEGLLSNVGNALGTGLAKLKKAGSDMKNDFQSGFNTGYQNQSPTITPPPTTTTSTPVGPTGPAVSDQQLGTSEKPGGLLGAIDKAVGTIDSIKNVYKNGATIIPVQGATYYDQKNRPHKFGEITTGFSNGNPGYFEFDHIDADENRRLRLFGQAKNSGDRSNFNSSIPLTIKFEYDEKDQPASQPAQPVNENLKTIEHLIYGQLNEYKSRREQQKSKFGRKTRDRRMTNNSISQVKGDKQVTKLQSIVKKYLGKEMNADIAADMVKDKNMLLDAMKIVDPELGAERQGKFGRQEDGSMDVSDWEEIKEQATLQTVKQFANTLGINNVDPSRLENLANKWSQFISAINTAGLGNLYKPKQTSDPETEPEEDPEEISPKGNAGQIYGYLVLSDPNNIDSPFKIISRSQYKNNKVKGKKKSDKPKTSVRDPKTGRFAAGNQSGVQFAESVNNLKKLMSGN